MVVCCLADVLNMLNMKKLSTLKEKGGYVSPTTEVMDLYCEQIVCTSGPQTMESLNIDETPIEW